MNLPERVRAVLTFTRFQAWVGIAAGVLSIGATVWGIVFATRTPVTSGEVVAIVVDARTEKPVRNALVELGTPRGALITTVLAKDGLARQTLKEGLYRLRVIHPSFEPEVRPVYVLAGHSQEIRVRLIAPPPPHSVGAEKDRDKAPPVDKAGQTPKQRLESK